jgi:hypothetical protein
MLGRFMGGGGAALRDRLCWGPKDIRRRWFHLRRGFRQHRWIWHVFRGRGEVFNCIKMTINGIFIHLFNEGLSIRPDNGINRFDTRSLQRFMIEFFCCFNKGMGKERQNCYCTQKPTEWHGILNTSPMTIACKTLFCKNRGGGKIPKFKNLKEFKLKLKHQKKQVIFWNVEAGDAVRLSIFVMSDVASSVYPPRPGFPEARSRILPPPALILMAK